MSIDKTASYLDLSAFIQNHGGKIKEDLSQLWQKDELALNIDETSGALDFDLALSVSEYFRLTQTEARSILSQVKKVVGDWKKTAKSIGISRGEIELMHSAFRY